MAIKRIVLSLAVMAILIELGMATNYTVGGPNGWDTSGNPKSWASSRSFFVGDNLLFQYSPMHNLIEVSKSDYDSCQPSNAINIFTDGNTVVPLSSPGKRYFICGTPGHCSQGMKVEINTLASTSSAPAAAPSLAPQTPPSSTSSPAQAPETAAPTASTPPTASIPPPTSTPPTASSPPLSAHSPSSSDVPSLSSPNIAPSTETREPAPAPSSASLNYVKAGFQAGLLVVMLLAF